MITVDERHSGPPIFGSIIKDPPKHLSSMSDHGNWINRWIAAGRQLAMHESYRCHEVTT